MYEPWLTKADAAKFWGCSERSLELAVKEGLPHAILFGRPKFRPSECEPWMEAHGYLERRNVDAGCTVGTGSANGAAPPVAATTTRPAPDQGGNP